MYSIVPPDRNVKSDLFPNVSSQVAIWDLRLRLLNHNIVPNNARRARFATAFRVIESTRLDVQNGAHVQIKHSPPK